MAHYAKIENNIVTQVVVAKPENFGTRLNSNDEKWIKTSYNTKGGIHYDPNTGQPSVDQSKALRKNFAGIGFTYDEELDAFIPPEIHPSWNLNKNTCLWEPPIPAPTDGKSYNWDEDSVSWKEEVPYEMS